MFDRWAMGPLRYDTGDCSGGGSGWTRSELGRDAPWLFSILEPHREKCYPDDLGDCFYLRGDSICCRRCKRTVAGFDRDYKSNQTVGIIGFGSFGQFMAKHLARAFHNVLVTDVVDRSDEAKHLIRDFDDMSVSGVGWGALEQAANREIVVLAVPFQQFEGLLKSISSHVQQGALVVDVCSVKQEPVRLMLECLPTETEILATHPLFGPQSAKDGLQGHNIVICPVRVKVERMARINNLLHFGYELWPVEQEPETHDREMAVVQGLTHFIARGLAGCGVKSSELATTAFDHLCKAVELLGGDSWELFKTIENGNPFAGEMRQRFMEELQKLERRLGKR